MKTEQEIKDEYHLLYTELKQPKKDQNVYRRAKLISRYETLHWVLFE